MGPSQCAQTFFKLQTRVSVQKYIAQKTIATVHTLAIVRWSA